MFDKGGHFGCTLCGGERRIDVVLGWKRREADLINGWSGGCPAKEILRLLPYPMGRLGYNEYVC